MNNMEDVIKFLQKILSKERFLHSLGAAKAAKKIAETYKVDAEKAYFAGLLHDCAKELSLSEMQKNALSLYPNLEKEILGHKNILHGYAGAGMVKKEFMVNDVEILHAITYHTTGNLEMNKLDKVVFLADSIEENRDFDGVEELRDLSKKNLDQAVLLAFDFTIKKLLQKKEEIYPLTIFSRNEILKLVKEKNKEVLYV